MTTRLNLDGVRVKLSEQTERLRQLGDTIVDRANLLRARLKRTSATSSSPSPAEPAPIDDFYTAIAPMFYLSRAVGVAPYSLARVAHGKRKLKKSKIAAAYSVVVLVLLVSCFLYVFVALYKNKTRAFTSYLEYGFDLVLVLMAVVTPLWKGDKILAFLDVLCTIDAANVLDATLMYTSARKFLRVQMLVLSLLFFVPLALLLVSIKNLGDLGPAWLVYFTGKLVPCVFIWQFVDCVALLRQRFKFVNDQLDDLVSPIYDNELLKNAFGKRVVVKAALNVPIVRYHRSLHDHLCDLSAQVNTLYTVTLLLFVTATFVNLVVELNYTLFPLLHSKQHDMFVLVSSSVITLLTVHVFVSAAASDVTGREANHTAVLVHKLLMVTDDIAILDELQMFSLQLLHRKVSFTCCGFFPLDATLLYSIVGGVTTYLVILLQFQATITPQSNAVIPTTIGLLPNVTGNMTNSTTTTTTTIKPKIVITFPVKPRG